MMALVEWTPRHFFDELLFIHNLVSRVKQRRFDIDRLWNKLEYFTVLRHMEKKKKITFRFSKHFYIVHVVLSESF